MGTNMALRAAGPMYLDMALAKNINVAPDVIMSHSY